MRKRALSYTLSLSDLCSSYLLCAHFLTHFLNAVVCGRKVDHTMDVDFWASRVHSAKHFSAVHAARLHSGTWKFFSLWNVFLWFFLMFFLCTKSNGFCGDIHMSLLFSEGEFLGIGEPSFVCFCVVRFWGLSKTMTLMFCDCSTVIGRD